MCLSRAHTHKHKHKQNSTTISVDFKYLVSPLGLIITFVPLVTHWGTKTARQFLWFRHYFQNELPTHWKPAGVSVSRGALHTVDVASFLILGQYFIFMISHEQHCGRQTHHDSVDPQRGAMMLSHKCLILIHSPSCLYCIRHLSKQTTCPHHSPFFGTLTSHWGQKWNFSTGGAALPHDL